MPHPALANRTPFAVALLPLSDEEGRAQLVPLMQATFSIGADGALERVDPQPDIDVGGAWWGDPETTSLRSEPQVAWRKPSTDVVLLGHACSPRGAVREIGVALRVGAVRKLVRVVGDRWLSGRGRISAPEPFERIPLVYERAFGGWDRRHDDPRRHRCEPRNPVGRGFRDASLAPGDDVPLPNLEDPDRPFRQYGDAPPPAGFGFLMPHWAPRAAFAGTYDEAWTASRMPLLPEDFDLRFFNAASPGLVTPAPLVGDETVTVLNATPSGRLDFALPGLPAPTCTLGLRGMRSVALEMRLDTVVVDADGPSVALTWRANHPSRNGIHDVVNVEFRVPGMLHVDPRKGQG